LFIFGDADIRVNHGKNFPVEKKVPIALIYTISAEKKRGFTTTIFAEEKRTFFLSVLIKRLLK